MHLVLNGRFLQQPVTGVQKFGREVTGHLHHLVAEDEAFDEIGVIQPPSLGRVRSRIWELYEIGRQISSTDNRCLLNLCNWSPLLPELPTVVVIHDTLWRENGRFYSPSYVAAQRLYWRFLRNSKRTTVVTVSNASREVLEEDLQRPVAVVRPGVRPLAPDRRALETKIDEYGRYALMIGGHDPRKNAAFVQGLAPKLAAFGLRVVLTRRSTTPTFRSSANYSDGVCEVIDPTDIELWTLYRGAKVLLHPSYGEGFGLPLLESSAVGTPFLSTDVGAARELCVSARQILPLDEQSWLEALDWVLTSPDLGARSKLKASTFSWSECAAGLLSVCRESMSLS